MNTVTLAPDVRAAVDDAHAALVRARSFLAVYVTPTAREAAAKALLLAADRCEAAAFELAGVA